VPVGSPEEVEPVPEHALPPDEAVALARALLAEGRPFFAHDVLEAVWKAAPAEERDLWQGLAQVCVGLTHLQRGNAVGAARLLRRGAERLEGRVPRLSYGVDVVGVAAQARAAAQAVDDGAPPPAVTL
jgi:hypothetical protein